MADEEPGAFLRACRGEPGARVPVWFMRQAGRALPEYRRLRGSGTILDAIRQPDLATEITLQPVRRYGVDAAILFSDIVVPVAAIGFGIDIRPGVGPVVDRPFRAESDLDRLRPLEPADDLPYVSETVENLVAELGDTPLIGFAGAPFTVASYLVEGQPSRTYRFTKTLMYSEPDLWQRLTDRLADLALASLRAQVEAGAAAVQLFDSWAGALNRSDYQRHVLPATRKVFEGIADLAVPCIHFGVGTGELLELMAEAGADVIGIDWHVQLDDARARLGDDVALQGNLDPVAVLAPWDVVTERVRDVLRRAGGHPGHIFNLGHGVLPETDPDVLARIVELVHTEGRADGTVAEVVEKSQLGGAPVQAVPRQPDGTASNERQESTLQMPVPEMPLLGVEPEGEVGESSGAPDRPDEATAL